MKKLTFIRNSIMELLPEKDGLIRTNPHIPQRKDPLPHKPRFAELKKRKRPSMKKKARVLTGIPKVKEKPSEAKRLSW